MKRDLTPEDLESITQAIFDGDRIEAINIYISITGMGLTEAQKFINDLTAEVKSSDPDRHPSKVQKKRNIWQRLIFPADE